MFVISSRDSYLAQGINKGFELLRAQRLGFQVSLAANLVLPIRQRSPFLCSSGDGDTWALGKTSQGPAPQGGTGCTPSKKQHVPSSVAGTSVQTEPRRDVTTPASSPSWSVVAAGGLLAPRALGHLAGFSPTDAPLFTVAALGRVME